MSVEAKAFVVGFVFMATYLAATAWNSATPTPKPVPAGWVRHVTTSEARESKSLHPDSEACPICKAEGAGR